MNYDEILKKLDWCKTKEEQKQGIELAKKINNIKVFFQPNDLQKNIGKNVWENCAIIIASYSDMELYEYLDDMFEWLQDLSWPGFNIILERLKMYNEDLLAEKLYKKIDLIINEQNYEWLINIGELILDPFQKKYVKTLTDNYLKDCEKQQIESIEVKKNELIEKLEDENYRPIALIALSKLKDKELKKYFKKYESDKNATVRMIAKQAIKAIETDI